MASSNERYWERSKALLTRDTGWVKPLLVLAAAHMVPVIGPFGADGYALEWARLTAWGVDSSPKQRGVDVWACVKTGARAFVVSLGYGLALCLIGLVLGSLLADAASEALSAVLGIMFMVVVTVAKLRATIYQGIGAGYQVGRIADMVKRDHRGLLRIAGMAALLVLAVSVAGGILMGGVLLSVVGSVVGGIIATEGLLPANDMYVLSLVISGIGKAMPMLLVIGYLIGIGATFTNLMVTTAVGLWMRQFDVRSWGESADPLPETTASPASEGRADQRPVSGTGLPAAANDVSQVTDGGEGPCDDALATDDLEDGHQPTASSEQRADDEDRSSTAIAHDDGQVASTPDRLDDSLASAAAAYATSRVQAEDAAGEPAGDDAEIGWDDGLRLAEDIDSLARGDDEPVA